MDESSIKMTGLFRDQPTTSSALRRTTQDANASQPQLPVILGMASVTLSIAVAIFLFTTKYTKTVLAHGQVVHAGGLTRLKASQTGTIRVTKAVEGQQVDADEIMFEISSDRRVDDTISLSAAIAVQKERQRSFVRGEFQSKSAMHSITKRELRLRLKGAKDEKRNHLRLIEALRDASETANRNHERAVLASARGLISQEQLDLKRLESIDRSAAVLTAERDYIRTIQRIEETEAEIARIPLREAIDGAVSSASDAKLTEGQVENEAKFIERISAPHSGVVTSIVAKPGQSVSAGATLALLEKRSDPLVVHIYVPSQAISSLRVGSRVFVEYSTGTARKYGKGMASITSIPTLPMTARELDAVAGLSFRPERAVSDELFFDVIATPNTDDEIRSPNGIPITAGAAARVSLPVETMPVYQWILEPVRAAYGKQRAKSRTT